MHKVILQEALRTNTGKELKGLSYKETKLEVKEGMTYKIFPDSLIPPRKRNFDREAMGPTQAAVAQNVAAPPPCLCCLAARATP